MSSPSSPKTKRPLESPPGWAPPLWVRGYQRFFVPTATQIRELQQALHLQDSNKYFQDYIYSITARINEYVQARDSREHARKALREANDYSARLEPVLRLFQKYELEGLSHDTAVVHETTLYFGRQNSINLGTARTILEGLAGIFNEVATEAKARLKKKQKKGHPKNEAARRLVDSLASIFASATRTRPGLGRRTSFSQFVRLCFSYAHHDIADPYPYIKQAFSDRENISLPLAFILGAYRTQKEIRKVKKRVGGKKSLGLAFAICTSVSFAIFNSVQAVYIKSLYTHGYTQLG